MTPKTPIKVELIGQDGNVFAIIGRVSKALKRAGFVAEAKEYTSRVMSCGSYDEALAITLEYVEDGDPDQAT